MHYNTIKNGRPTISKISKVSGSQFSSIRGNTITIIITINVTVITSNTTINNIVIVRYTINIAILYLLYAFIIIIITIIIIIIESIINKSIKTLWCYT